MKPIGLTDFQLEEIKSAVATLLPSQRSEALAGIARHLGENPSNESVALAISMELSKNRVPQFLCDAKTVESP
jgi:hypothetical protein